MNYNTAITLNNRDFTYLKYKVYFIQNRKNKANVKDTLQTI